MALTVNSLRYNVNGAWREIYYDITNTQSGDTLTTPFHVIRYVDSNQPSALTTIAAAAGVLTFTGTATAAKVLVIGK